MANKKKNPAEDMVTIRNFHTEKEFDIAASLWKEKRAQYGSTFIQVRKIKVPPEVKALQKKKALPEQSAPTPDPVDKGDGVSED